MNNKEALWFVGKCLSLSVHPEKASSIREFMESEQVDWNLVVYQSSNQFVMPALYLNLKRNNLLASLPPDLVSYLKEIADLNRERNNAILNQLVELTQLLRKHQIEPVFLKGSAHLLDGLYPDNTERMLGDIDLLLEEKEAFIAYDILKENGYQSSEKINEHELSGHRHLPRLLYPEANAAVEIHRYLLKEKYNKTFGWSDVKNNFRKSECPGGALLLSNADSMLYNMLNVQVNDKARYSIFLRQSYDLMLLSKKDNPLEVVKSFGRNFNLLNRYVALSADLLDYPSVLTFDVNKYANRYLGRVHRIWDYPKFFIPMSQLSYIMYRVYGYLKKAVLFIFRSKARRKIIRKISEPNYLIKHIERYKKRF